MKTILAERGYLIVARTSPTVDYVRCARVLAHSIRQHTPNAKICLLTDGDEAAGALWDVVEPFPFALDPTNPYAGDWQSYWASPWRETIKLEADMILPTSIEHWWPVFRLRDWVASVGCRDYRDEAATSRAYRAVFDHNGLPDIYSAITYWRRSRVADQMWILIKQIFEEWPQVQSALRYAESDVGSTDLVYAIAAQIIGPERVTLPEGMGPEIVHMKPAINGLACEDWRRELVWEISSGSFRAGTYEVRRPFHYHVKAFAADLEAYYGR